MIVEIVLTCVTVLGLMLYYWEELYIGIHLIKGKVKLYAAGIKRGDGTREENTIKSNPVYILTRLLTATTGVSDKRVTYGFMFLSASLGLAVFLLLSEYITWKLLAVVTVSATILPTLLLLCRLQILRVKASREGEVLLMEILDNYKINYYNMYQAIEVTALTIKEAPGSKRLLFNLSKGLNTASRHEDIRAYLKDFEFALGTSWARVMTDNMYYALVSGIRVTAAMEDLVETLSQARKVSEFAKRENNESGLILSYMVPVCYIMTVVAAVKYFGLTLDEYMRYQFMTTTGMGWFVISLMIYFAGIFVNFFISKNKLDL